MEKTRSVFRHQGKKRQTVPHGVIECVVPGLCVLWLTLELEGMCCALPGSWEASIVPCVYN